MHYLRKSIRQALNESIKRQLSGAKFSAFARRLVADGWQIERAADWQNVSANDYKWARHYRDQFVRLSAEYAAAEASIVKVEGEWHMRTRDGTTRLYTTKRDDAIARANGRLKDQNNA